MHVSVFSERSLKSLAIWSGLLPQARAAAMSSSQTATVERAAREKFEVQLAEVKDVSNQQRY
jgi:hypothetical protein